MTRYDLLWQAFATAAARAPGNLARAIGELPAVGQLPSPWETWTLIGLVRQHRRQLWVGAIVANRLGGDLQTLARRGALGRPRDREPAGVVPGLPEWEYRFHGCGCCLSHRVSGESIDVDFFGPTADSISEWFYLDYLRSLRSPGPAEARLLTLHPSVEPIRLAIGELCENRLLVPLDSRSRQVFRLSPEALARADSVDAFCQAWEHKSARVWLGSLIGDWLAAHEAARASADQRTMTLISRQATALRAKRCARLLSPRENELARADALRALADLDAEELAAQLCQALEGPVCAVTTAAIEIIGRRNDPSWCSAVYRLIDRLDPDGPAPGPYVWSLCIEFLLVHAYRPPDVRALLGRAGGPGLGTAALLALEHAPESSLALFRRALRSPIPMNRIDAAAVLAIIDRPWSRDELLAVLRESTEQESTSECRAALRECHDAAAQHAVETWEIENPHEPESGVGITMREMVLRNTPWWIRHRMDSFHDRVLRLRQRVLDEGD